MDTFVMSLVIYFLMFVGHRIEQQVGSVGEVVSSGDNTEEKISNEDG